MKDKKMMEMCDGDWCSMHHKRSKGVKLLILGLLVLWNAYMPFISWAGFIGAIIGIAGLWKILMPHDGMMM